MALPEAEVIFGAVQRTGADPSCQGQSAQRGSSGGDHPGRQHKSGTRRSDADHLATPHPHKKVDAQPVFQLSFNSNAANAVVLWKMALFMPTDLSFSKKENYVGTT